MVTRAQGIKLVIYDFDGVLTDNRVLISQEGLESVSCNRGDGWWMNEIKKLGIEQLILSTEKNPVVSARAAKIGLEAIQGQSNKKAALLEIAEKKGVALKDVCYLGNEMNDLECLRIVGFSICPRDSHPEVLKIAKHTFPVDGGQGIVRYLYDWLNSPLSPELSSEAILNEKKVSNSKIQTTISESIRVKQALLKDQQCLTLLEQMGTIASAALKAGKKILFAGNGGSFADSMHLAAEFVSKLQIDRAPLAALALGCGNSNLTAIGNDYGYEHTFAREIFALGNEGDVFIAISTSGNSPNILRAVEAAKEKKLHVFGWSGQMGGKLALQCPTIRVPSSETARIQECHILIGHILCEIAETPFLK